MEANHEVDLSLAIQLQAQFEEELRISLLRQEDEKKQILVLSQNVSGFKNKHGELSEPAQHKLSVSLVDPTWELIDPNPDIHTLFLTFNDQFFWGRLAGVEVRWSPRMTLCAGVCSYEGRGGLCSVRLSLPLLKLRPRKDLIETLLHEMIHAYLFVTANNRDRDGHGPEFHKHMYRLNGVAGTKISVYHSFHDEVDVYRQHIWQCDGPCRKSRPYFGLVKRSTNRVPGPRDPWWQRHQQSCGGTYTKIQEPEGYGVKKKKSGMLQDKKDAGKNPDIRKFFGGFKGVGTSLAGDSSLTSGKGAVSKVKNFGNSTSKENFPDYKKRTGSGSTNGKRSSDGSSTSKENFPDYKKRTGTGSTNGKRSSDGSSTSKENFPDYKKRTGSGSTNGKRSSDFSNAGSGGVNGKRKHGDSISASSTNSSKVSNIHGLGSTATGTVRQMNINNASRSQVHGFGRGSSPVKKPHLGSKDGSGNRMGTGRGFGSGGGLAVRGGGASRTFTVKGKAPKNSQTETVNEEPQMPTTSTFQGSGHSLGGQGTGVSRLLSLSYSQPSRNIDKKCSSSSKSNDKTRKNDYEQCPVCNKDILKLLIDKHLKDCIGEFDDDDDWDEVDQVSEINPVEKKIGEVDTISVSSDDSDEFMASNSNQTPSLPPMVGNQNGSSKENTYPCPVCSEHFTQGDINQHLDAHF